MNCRAAAALVFLLGAGSPIALAQNVPMYATGPLTPGHAVVLQQTGTPGASVVRDAGPALAGNFTELGITNNGLPLCVQDSPKQHILCLGANVGGTGLISFNPIGSGAPTDLQFNINGSTFTFPGGGGGGGNVVGPASSTIGHVAIWANTTGTLLADIGTLSFSAPGPAPFSPFSITIGAFPPAGFVPAATENGITSTMVVPGTYTQQPWPNSNFFAGMVNGNTGAAGNSTVNYLAASICPPSNPNCTAIGINTVFGNTPNVWGGPSGTGNNFGLGVGYEINANIMSISGARPSGSYVGVKVLGDSDISPSADSFATAIYPLGPSVPFDIGHYSADASTTYFADIGAVGTGNGVASQAILFRSRTAGGVNDSALLFADQNGNLTATAPTFVAQTFSAVVQAHILQYAGTDIITANATDNVFEDPTGNGRLFLGSGTTIQRNTTTLFQDSTGATTFATVNASGLNLGSGEVFSVGATNGVTCPTGSPTASFATVGGIVIHC